MRKHHKKQSQVEITTNRNEIEKVFSASVLPLDNQLINQLVISKGWPRENLEDARATGLGYCPERNSIMSLLPEIIDGDLGMHEFSFEGETLKSQLHIVFDTVKQIAPKPS